jgi:hypothetical protein
MEPSLLLKRLDEIGRSLARSGHALALIGLGSVGVELERWMPAPIWTSLPSCYILSAKLSK